MTDYLLKLKKDGKTVGYLNIGTGIHWSDEVSIPSNYIEFDTAHPFVCKDKNGDDVFANDEVNIAGHKAIIKQNDDDFGYHLEFVNLPVMESIKIGRKLTNILYREMCRYIELVKEE